MKPVKRKTISSHLVAMVFFCTFFLVAKALGSYQTITNDVWLYDNNGNPIFAQGGGISKFGNTYYWYGIQYLGAGEYYTNYPTDNADVTFQSINCYSSADLAHWKFENKVVSKSTPGFSGGGWVGRMGSVVYNSTNQQYVMWFQGPGGMVCCTNASPTGNFRIAQAQGTLTNVFNSSSGDVTVFCDVDHNSTPYLIYSDSHGREHAYVSTFSPDYQTISAGTLISEWPQGQEANNMFERNGVYYYIMSNTAGWSYSTAYQVNSPSILNAGAYTADATFKGTDIDNTHYSQVSFCVEVQGTMETNYVYVGDRWADFSSNYASASHGKGYNIFCPLSFTNATPYFSSVTMFQIDTVTGKWRAAIPADAPAGVIAAAGNAQVILNWPAVDGATGYNVKRSSTSGGAYAVVANTTANSFTDTALSNGSQYYYVVSSTNMFGESTNSTEVSVVPSIGPIITAASASPNPVFPSQVVNFSAALTAQANPIGTVTVDVSAIGGSTSQPLFSDGNGNFTNCVTVGATAAVGPKTLTINAADNLGNISSPYPFSLIIGSVNETWDGGAGDDNWSSSGNWNGDVSPGFGYNLIFAGPNRLTPVMDNSCSIYALTFDNTASPYTISAIGGALTLTGGLTNNSASVQTVNVPIILGSPITVNAVSGDVMLGQTVNNGGNLLTTTDGGHSISVTGAIFGNGGLTKMGAGTNTLYGVNTFGGNLIISNGTLTVGGAGQLGGGTYAGTIVNNGILTYNSTAAQAWTGIFSGSGSLNEQGAGLLTLSGANTFNGATVMSSGGLQLANSLALQNSVLSYNGGNLGFNGISAATLGGLSGTVGSQNLILKNIASGAVAMSVGGNNISTVYGGNLSGTGSLIKNGTGSLTLSNANYTGNTTVNSTGILTITGGSLGSSSSTISVNGSTSGGNVLVLSGGLTVAQAFNVAVSANQTGVGATINGSANASFANSSLGAGGNTLGNVTVNTTGNVGLGNVTLGKDNAGQSSSKGLVIQRGVVTAAKMDVQGAGTSSATAANLNLTGGTLAIGNSSSSGAFKVGDSSTGGHGGYLTMTGGALTYLGTDGLLAAAGGTAGNIGIININGGSATLTGVTLNQQNSTTANSTLSVGGSAQPTLYLGSVGLVANPAVSGTVSINFSNAIVGAVADWSSAAPLTLTGTTSFQAADAAGAAHTVSLNGILSGTGSVIKTGNGILVLGSANTYSGVTLITNGSLVVNGSLAAAGSVTVANGGALGGTGIINGPVTVQSGGTLVPGGFAGTLTISNSLALAAGCTNIFEISHSPLTNQVVKIAGLFTSSGLLIVSNISPVALAAGDSFKLFDAAGYAGSFSGVNLPLLPAGLGWNTNSLNTAGLLSVVVTTTPVINLNSTAGGIFQFQGTGGVAGNNFYLLGTTNLGTPVSGWTRLMTNQFDHDGNFNFSRAVDPDWSQGFYLLQLP